MYESSGSQFFSTTIGIQSETDAFDESKLVVTFLTILRVIMQFQTIARREIT